MMPKSDLSDRYGIILMSIFNPCLGAMIIIMNNYLAYRQTSFILTVWYCYFSIKTPTDSYNHGY